MADLLSTGISALLAYQKSLATTGHNIANANTEGYTRQRVEQVSRLGTALGSGFIGSGVEVSTVTRVADRFATERLMFDASNMSQQETLQTLTGRVDKILSDRNLGLTDPLSEFYAAVDGVATDPTSSAARQVLLGKAELLAGRFQNLQNEFDSLNLEVNRQLQQQVGEINTLTEQIADMNDRIAIARGLAGGQPPNDLLDQRDELVRELASHIGIATVTQDDGALNIFTAGGNALVLGTTVSPLRLVQDDFNADRYGIALQQGNTLIPLTRFVSGGSLGGLLSFRRDVLDPAAGDLGRVAVALADTFNAQHAEGVDLYGDLGGDFFDVPAPGVSAATNNDGPAVVGVAYDDVGGLTGETYLMRFTGSAWELQSAETGDTVATFGAASGTFTAAGLSIAIAAGAVAGDRYEIRATRGAAGSLDVAITDAARIAAAAPVRTEAALANDGTGVVGRPEVLDVADADLLLDATIVFDDPPGTFTITDSNGTSAPIAFTVGGNIAYNGWRIQIAGTPAAGDTFQVLPVAANSGDNGNARLLADIRNLGVLDGGTRSLNGGYGALVAQVGAQAQQAAQRVAAQTAIREHDQSFRDSVSGVNLDEEAANMVRFQQAYQASAQIIALTDTLFQTILSAVRR